jgi:hypothetical protein
VGIAVGVAALVALIPAAAAFGGGSPQEYFDGGPPQPRASGCRR